MGHGAVDVAGVVRHLLDTISGRVHVERVILFGSRARGEAAEASDVDLLVVSPDSGVDTLADYALLYGAIPPLDIDVDVIPRTPERIAAAEPDSFLATVLEDGVVVYQDGSPDARPTGAHRVKPTP